MWNASVRSSLHTVVTCHLYNLYCRLYFEYDTVISIQWTLGSGKQKKKEVSSVFILSLMNDRSIGCRLHSLSLHNVLACTHSLQNDKCHFCQHEPDHKQFLFITRWIILSECKGKKRNEKE